MRNMLALGHNILVDLGHKVQHDKMTIRKSSKIHDATAAHPSFHLLFPTLCMHSSVQYPLTASCRPVRTDHLLPSSAP